MVAALGGELMFRTIKPFDLAGVMAVPHKPGIYVIYKRDGTPYYVGRSRVDIFARLWKHLHGLGSMRIKAMLDQGVGLNFEFQEMISVEQAEAMLIKEMGVLRFGNLRRESDPADWA
jgi:excinuclease UvrABC nuclease subunit